jgi:undecaprenyl-diphosphatase
MKIFSARFLLYLVLALVFIILGVIITLTVQHSEWLETINYRVADFVQSTRFGWALGPMVALTYVTSQPVLVSLLGLACLLVLIRHRAHAIPYLVSVLLFTLLAVFAIKQWLAVARPQGGLIMESSYSFPSGHAAVSMVLALAFTLILTTHRERLRGGAVLITLALLIGLSRIYIGVHRPSEVLAGWLLAVLIASISWPIAKHFLHGRTR